MIREHCFTEEWLDYFRQQNKYRKIDKIILEKMIYALHLLERLKTNGLDFIFKGGTSLVLLLEEDNRFSIDIDIICSADRKTLESILEKVIDTSKFNSYEPDEHRSFKTGVPKAHYSFSFNSSTKGKYKGTILLDVLFEKSNYPELTEKPISTKWIETESVVKVHVPTIDSITGDKLTAFAPNTIGIPYFKGEDKQPFSMEICKQLFDLGKLFEHIQDISIVSKSYHSFAVQEIEYRNTGEMKMTPADALKDTLDTCLIISKRGRGTQEEISKFTELQNGIKAFGFGFLMGGNFRIDDAIPAAAKVAYLSAKLLANDLAPIEYYRSQDIKEYNIEDPEWNFLNPLKKQPNKSSYYYWYHTVQILKKLKN